jgi:hypothetical protein
VFKEAFSYSIGVWEGEGEDGRERGTGGIRYKLNFFAFKLKFYIVVPCWVKKKSQLSKVCSKALITQSCSSSLCVQYKMNVHL